MAGAAAPLAALTSLRFFAAFAVLLLHYRELLGPLPPWLLRGILGGQHGVTSPAHLVECAAAGALASDGALYGASWLINALGLQAWVPRVPFAMFWNTPAWSVSAEWFFYAIFPFVTVLLARRVHGTRALALAFGAVRLGGIALYAGVIYGVTWVWPVKGPSRRWWLLDVAAKYGAFVLPFAGLILALVSGRTVLHGVLERPALLMLATVAASVAVYRVFELPWRARLRGQPPAAGRPEPLVAREVTNPC